MIQPRIIRVKPVTVKAEGFGESSTVTVRGWRPKRTGVPELVEVVFTEVSPDQILCFRRTTATRLKEVRDYIAQRWNRIVQEVGRE